MDLLLLLLQQRFMLFNVIIFENAVNMLQAQTLGSTVIICSNTNLEKPETCRV